MKPDLRPAARAGLYRLLALGFSYPERRMLDAIRAGLFQDAVTACTMAAGTRPGAFPLDAIDDTQLESAYVELFDLSGSAAACVLCEGSHGSFVGDDRFDDHGGGASSVMEDLLRFYHFFGYRLARDPARRLPPDHAVCQFEMLSHLCDGERGAALAPAHCAGARQAQGDFLGRHLAAWWPRAVRRLRSVSRAETAHAFYVAMADVAADCVAAHCTELSGFDAA